jgi:hypothetical protein
VSEQNHTPTCVVGIGCRRRKGHSCNISRRFAERLLNAPPRGARFYPHGLRLIPGLVTRAVCLTSRSPIQVMIKAGASWLSMADALR